MTTIDDMREAIRNRLENGYPIRSDETVAEITDDYRDCTGEAFDVRTWRARWMMNEALKAEGFRQPSGVWWHVEQLPEVETVE